MTLYDQYFRMPLRKSALMADSDVSLARSFREQQAGIPVIVTSNVTEYMYAGTDQEGWPMGSAFPNVAPPFQRFWMETRAPSRIVSSLLGDNPWSQDLIAWAAAFYSEPATDGWHVAASLLMTTKLSEPVTSIGAVMFEVDSSGAIRPPPGDMYRIALFGARVKEITKKPGMENFGTDLVTYLKPFMLALSFMHCKNVELQEHLPPRHERRQAEKDGGPKPTKYYTLDIAPMRTVLRGEGRSESVGLPKALHICRGHFVTYDERPLFGKIRGTFWKDAHLRGNPAHGIVEKDYRVMTPKNTEET